MIKKENNKENRETQDDKIKSEDNQMARLSRTNPISANQDFNSVKKAIQSPPKGILVNSPSKQKQGTPEQISQFTDEQQQNSPSNNFL